MTRSYDCADTGERAAGMREAVAAVRRGDLVVLPTDTVYGLGTDAFSATGIATLLGVKGRGRKMPVPVLVGSPQTLHGIVAQMPQTGWDLVDAFWPGGLTIVAMHQPTLRWDLGETRGTVAVRMPLHPVALELLETTGPMGVSSANLSGHRPARTASEAREQLGESVAVYLDAGVGGEVSSTIVDITGPTPRVLRLGTFTVEQLREVVPDIEIATEPAPAATSTAAGPDGDGAGPDTGKQDADRPDEPAAEEGGSDGGESQGTSA